MNTITWIILTTFMLSAASLVGAFFLVMNEKTIKKIIHPLVAFSAGSLLGGALLHVLPEAIEAHGEMQPVFISVLIGFSVFFLLEQFIHWHHCHKTPSEHHHPVTYLILISDALHNFLDGLAIGAAFMIDVRLGLLTSLVIATHEIPQEMGDLGVLIHGGWAVKKALLFNFLSGLTMIAGGLLAYAIGREINIAFLLPFAAGNFIYVAASDLIPEVKHRDNICQNGIHFAAFFVGLLLMWSMTLIE